METSSQILCLDFCLGVLEDLLKIINKLLSFYGFTRSVSLRDVGNNHHFINFSPGFDNFGQIFLPNLDLSHGFVDVTVLSCFPHVNVDLLHVGEKETTIGENSVAASSGSSKHSVLVDVDWRILVDLKGRCSTTEQSSAGRTSSCSGTFCLSLQIV